MKTLGNAVAFIIDAAVIAGVAVQISPAAGAVLLVCAMIATMVGRRKGQSAGPWFIVGAMLSILAVPAVLLTRDEPRRPCPHYTLFFGLVPGAERDVPQ